MSYLENRSRFFNSVIRYNSHILLEISILLCLYTYSLISQLQRMIIIIIFSQVVARLQESQCGHNTVMKDMCVDCGADLRKYVIEYIFLLKPPHMSVWLTFFPVWIREIIHFLVRRDILYEALFSYRLWMHEDEKIARYTPLGEGGFWEVTVI